MVIIASSQEKKIYSDSSPEIGRMLFGLPKDFLARMKSVSLKELE